MLAVIKMEWEHDDREIDAITCASKVENVDEIVTVVVRKIRAHRDEEKTSDKHNEVFSA